MKKILIELRIKHYIKNIMVFLPLVFSLNLLSPQPAAAAVLVFLSFCFGSSAIYVINDIADAPRDRCHPRKKHRPIASGAIGIRQAIFLAVTLLSASLSMVFFANLVAFLCLAAYIVLNILYSFILKHYAIIDVFCIMSGFLLRITAGAAAIDVPVSNWLLLTVMSLSLFLGFGKRRNELSLNTAGATRRTLLKYTADFLDKTIYSMMTLSIAFYALWAIDRDTIAHLGTENLIWTTPLVVAGLLRYVQLLDDRNPKDDASDNIPSIAADSASFDNNDFPDGDPTNIIFADAPIRLIIVVYIVVVIVITYIY